MYNQISTWSSGNLSSVSYTTIILQVLIPLNLHSFGGVLSHLFCLLIPLVGRPPVDLSNCFFVLEVDE